MGRVSINVSGIVQGVGFRPYVFRLAIQMGLKGFVRNTGGGVLIEVQGDGTPGFVERLKAEAPPLARITALDIRELPQEAEYADFRIIESGIGHGRDASADVSADVSVCPDCLRELSDPADRRYLYPFINCTNCGPRYSIIMDIPYDRENTTMSVFGMCPECGREYADPGNRRFHAEPSACPVCGPSVSTSRGLSSTAVQKGGTSAQNPIALAIRELKDGGIVAIKGLGGFHLACDAANEKAVSELRRRKKRANKPFALMAASVEEVRLFCHLTAEEEEKLLSPGRPVVLLRKKDECALPPAVAPGNGRLGFMLPYTPLHWLLFNYPGENCLNALVMTSGNLSEEPIVIDNGEALKKLSGIAGNFLFHDRDIHTRVDDSVVYKISPGNGPPFFAFARRARGYVPGSISLGNPQLSGKPREGRNNIIGGKFFGPQVMGAGGDLKNTFTLAKGGRAVVSQHIGDMENPGAQTFYLETLEKLMRLFRMKPEAAGYDMHPGYHSSNLALGLDIPQKFAIQHHHAHIASVMAEIGHTGKVIGVALDGTGYGPDGTLWGGEFLLADAIGFERAACFRPIPLPGGEAAVREPWRAAIGLLGLAFPEEIFFSLAQKSGIIGRHTAQEVENVLKVAKKPELSPLSSGAGRLFEAFSSVLGLVDANTFEAEAAIALESIAGDIKEDFYPYDISDGGRQVDFSGAFARAIEEKYRGVHPGAISARFHNTVARAVSETAIGLSAETGIRTIVLSGGVFQNRFLLEGVMGRLSMAKGISVHTNRLVPPGDGGLSLGQAFIARERAVQ